MEKIDLPKLPSTLSGLFLSLNVLFFITSLIALLLEFSNNPDLCKKIMWISGVGIAIGAIFYYVVEPYLEAKYSDRYSWMETISGGVAKEFFVEYLTYWAFGLIVYFINLFFTLLLF